jgi:hypothetical protein
VEEEKEEDDENNIADETDTNLNQDDESSEDQ